MAKYNKAPSEMRPEIIAAMLDHVPFDGWSEAGMKQAAGDLGVPLAFIKMAFPGGAAEMVEEYLLGLDSEMLKLLKKKRLDKMGMTKRIVTAVKVRLEINHGHREAVRRTVGFLALPFNAPLAAKCLWRTVDAMWNAAGDTATDYNHYTKRLILGGVYSTTLITWLGDESEGYQDTFEFLDRRIANVMEFEKVKAKAREFTKDLPDLAKILGKMRYPDGHRRP
ncbi:MAG: COQ9 family protein [Alphaproteobacteria bacterium]|nr:MAG: COQ9 family protein [Alphaproteobacteria bacterium]